MLTIIWSVIAFIVAIAILITVHEYGHFIVARLLDIRVLRFSIGFGKPLWKRVSKKGVEFVIAVFPLGGYVKMLDENEGPVDEDQKHLAFNNQPLWKRFLVIVAGPMFNFAFAIIAFWFVFFIGFTVVKPIIGEVLPNSIAAKSSLPIEHIITAVDEKNTRSWRDVSLELVAHVGNKKPVTLTLKPVKGSGERNYLLNMSTFRLQQDDSDIIKGIGLVPYFPKIPLNVAKVSPDSPAEQAGILPGDVFVAVNGSKVANWQDLVDYISPRPNTQVRVTVERSNNTKQFTLTTSSLQDEDGNVRGIIGVTFKPINWPKDLLLKESYGFFAAWGKAAQQTWQMTSLSYRLLGKMIVGKLSLASIRGPIGIAEGAGVYARLGIVPYLGFLALISLSLGIVNLLPIPVLDGGHLLYLVIEMVKGKPMSERAQEMGIRIGLFVILGIMFFAFYNDIVHLVQR